MVTGVIKNKIDKIWTDLWAGGITNPLTVIEQLTYLMFIRSLDERNWRQKNWRVSPEKSWTKFFRSPLQASPCGGAGLKTATREISMILFLKGYLRRLKT